MRYFFHAARSGLVYTDETGTNFGDSMAAMAHAVRIARELADDGSMDDFWVAVTDEDGKTVGEVPVVPDDLPGSLRP